MLHLDDTICAIATPPGEGGVGIVRISGADSFRIADRIFRLNSGRQIPYPSHTIHYGRIIDPQTMETVDDVLLLAFRAPHSYTGEDSVELSCHGGPVTLGRVLNLAVAAGARLAEPGEFTQRAFLNGRMDLAQAEAVCDQIRAKTEAAQRLARRQKEGALSKEIHRLRDELVGSLAAVEVTIDFSEEVGDLDYPAIAGRLEGIRTDLERLASTAQGGRLYREGARIAIVGRPNVGKSSLLNALLRHERAIVTPIAGTTRDTIEETVNIRGIPVVAIDTAGIRETLDEVERMGVERASAAVGTAALALHVLDGSVGWTDDDDLISRKTEGISSLLVLNKSDLISEPDMARRIIEIADRAGSERALSVSAITGAGIDTLEAEIASILLGNASEDTLVISNVRHLTALQSAIASVNEALSTVQKRLPPDFISIDLRGALDELGQITGETAGEEIIHRIFHDFCVGK